MSMSEGEHGGYKGIIAKISGDGVYGRLVSPADCVQRVPATDAEGRIRPHSACTVAVTPELPEAELPDINPARICALIRFVLPARAVSTLTPPSAVVLPTCRPASWWNAGTSVRSKNKAALSVLGARIHAAETAKRQQAESVNALPQPPAAAIAAIVTGPIISRRGA